MECLGDRDQRCELALSIVPQKLMHRSITAFKVVGAGPVLRAAVQARERGRGTVSLVPEAAARKTLLKRVSAIASAGGPVTASERGRLARLSQVLVAPIEKTAAHATPGRPSSARATTRSGAVLH